MSYSSDNPKHSNQFGVGQMLHEHDPSVNVLLKERLEKSMKYMEEKKKDVEIGCRNMAPDCTLWASQVSFHLTCSSFDFGIMYICVKSEIYCLIHSKNTIITHAH